MTREQGEHPYSRGDLVRHLASRSIAEFSDDRCPQFAAAIAYHVLFALFPLAIALTAVFGIVVRLAGVQADVIDNIAGLLPLSANGTQRLRDLLRDVTGNLSALGLLGVVGVLYSASGMMTAIRVSVNAAFDVEEARPFIKGRLVDLGLVFVTGLAVLASVSLTLAVRFVDADAGATAQIALGGSWGSWVLGVVLPFVAAAGTTFAILRYVPAAPVRTRHAAFVGLGLAVVFVVAENAFALYVSNFANYNAIYGSLGAIIAFMFFVYLSAMLLLFGAEVASEWPKVVRALERGSAQKSPPAAVQARQMLRGLWTRERQREGEREHAGDDG